MEALTDINVMTIPKSALGLKRLVENIPLNVAHCCLLVPTRKMVLKDIIRGMEVRGWVGPRPVAFVSIRDPIGKAKTFRLRWRGCGA